MHFLPLALSRWLCQIATRNSEHGIGAASSARAMHLSKEHPGCEIWERRSREMIKRGRHRLGGWESWIDGVQVSLRNKKEKNKRTKNKQKIGKQTKEAEKSKSRDEKQTRLMSSWALLRVFFRGLPDRLLRESEA
jgi:hypothetical protein